MAFIDIRKTYPALQGNLIHTVRIPDHELVSTLEQIGFTVFVINGSVISDKKSFFVEVARALNFPSYFGKNWDAFDECMEDFCEGVNRSNTAIVWNNVDKLLSTDLQTFTDAICCLYEKILGIKWAIQGEDQSKTTRIEVFLVGNDPRFPTMTNKK